MSLQTKNAVALLSNTRISASPFFNSDNSLAMATRGLAVAHNSRLGAKPFFNNANNGLIIAITSAISLSNVNAPTFDSLKSAKLVTGDLILNGFNHDNVVRIGTPAIHLSSNTTVTDRAGGGRPTNDIAVVTPGNVCLENMTSSPAKRFHDNVSTSDSSQNGTNRIVLQAKRLIIRNKTFIKTDNLNLFNGNNLISVVTPQVDLSNRSPSNGPDNLLTQSFFGTSTNVVHLRDGDVALAGKTRVSVSTLKLKNDNRLRVGAMSLTIADNDHVTTDDVLKSTNRFAVATLKLIAVTSKKTVATSVLASKRKTAVGLATRHLQLSQNFVSTSAFNDNANNGVAVRAASAVRMAKFNSVDAGA